MTRSLFVGSLLLGFGTLSACGGGDVGDGANTDQTAWSISQVGALTVSECTATSEFEVLSTSEHISFIAVDARDWSGSDLNVSLFSVDEQGHESLVRTEAITASSLDSNSSDELVESDSAHHMVSNSSSSSTDTHSDSTSVVRTETGSESESAFSENSSERLRESIDDEGPGFERQFDHESADENVSSESEFAFTDQRSEASQNNSSNTSSVDNHADESASASSRLARQSAFEALESLASSENLETSLDRTEVFMTDDRQERRFIIRVEFSGNEDRSTIHVLAGAADAVRVQREFEQQFNACK